MWSARVCGLTTNREMLKHVVTLRMSLAVEPSAKRFCSSAAAAASQVASSSRRVKKIAVEGNIG